ncbi:cupin domain-containing protein [Natronorubrum sp. JWXQ-INN-674]|uniref:Cupin domain-containing protein n=1 Tax=Natronorubrum halalkaliphilum TaxID=2691917 RepID=A0A6B0VSN1_9EURY|nr:cupin domain-containing protein [Natronorubrum halalkaliphilum]MXV64057.1 cupin domain-containing protein [Natronorubrum halalkaliphilum]
MSDVTVHRLEERWDESRDEPFALFESDDPNAEVGSYVIEPGERVPENGTTSHAGDEISVILSGEIDLVADGERITVGPESVTVIPAGVDHYSENTTDELVRLVYAVLGDL